MLLVWPNTVQCFVAFPDQSQACYIDHNYIASYCVGFIGYAYIRMYVIHTYRQTDIHIDVHTDIHTHTHTHTCMHACMHTYVHIHTYADQSIARRCLFGILS